MTNSMFYVALFFCVAVTLIPRIIPFLLPSSLIFPRPLELFLKYLPLSMMTALFFENIFVIHNEVPTINFTATIAIVPGIIIGYFTRSLLWVIVAGVVMMGLIRLFIH